MTEPRAKESTEEFNANDFLFRTTDGSQWEIPDAETFDFAGFFDWMADCRQLLLAKEELTWLARQRAPDHDVDVFLNMSCGTQLAPHLTLDTVGVLQALGVDFVAGAGRQFCCGKVYRGRGREDAGERMSQASLNRFVAWGARTAVHGCHSCQIVYSDFTAHNQEAAPSLTNLHLSAFLENRLSALSDQTPWKKEVPVRVLVEGHGPELSPVHDAATQSAARILAMIPGVEVAGFVEPPAMGLPCKSHVPGGPTILAEITDDERRRLLDELEAQAAAKGADTIAPSAHYCHREWSKFSTDRLAVRNYISILAEGLGCAHVDRYQELWKLRDPEAVLRQTRPFWESWGLSEDDARRVAYKNFDPHFTGFVNIQCACGGDPTKCNTGRHTLAKSASAPVEGAIGHEF